MAKTWVSHPHGKDTSSGSFSGVRAVNQCKLVPPLTLTDFLIYHIVRLRSKTFLGTFTPSESETLMFVIFSLSQYWPSIFYKSISQVQKIVFVSEHFVSKRDLSSSLTLPESVLTNPSKILDESNFELKETELSYLSIII